MAEEGAGKATEFLTKKAGPLPVGVWIVLVAGGLGVTYYLNRGKGNSNDVASTGTTGNGVVDATGSGTYQPVGGNAGSSGGGSGSSGSNTFADNNAWGTASVNYLISLGYDPGIANQAIALYLSSSSLTTQQQAMVNSALQHFGVPPLIPAPTNGGNTGGNTSGDTPAAPSNLHINKLGANVNAATFDADTVADFYDVEIKSDANKTYVTTVPGPHRVATTSGQWTYVPGHSYTITVSGRTIGGKTGPSASVHWSG